MALEAAGARPQRLLVASTSAKDPSLKPTFYVEALIAPGTINTMPEATLLAFAEVGVVGDPMPADAAGADEMLARVEEAGVNLESLATLLQEQGRDSFIASWHELLDAIVAKRAALQEA
jgi:transaldolase